jgi:hypothetical protein
LRADKLLDHFLLSMNLQGIFQLEGHDHTCGRSNDKHQKRLDALMQVVNTFLVGTDSSTGIKVYADRLPRALAFLRQTELWKRYEAESPADREAALDAAQVAVMSAVSKSEEPMACEGCQYLRSVYAMAPSMAVSYLRESFEVAMRGLAMDDEDRPLAERALAMVEDELLTIGNIAAHVDELLE